MAEQNLKQHEADALIAMEKRRLDATRHDFGGNVSKLSVDLQSLDGREAFVLDLWKGSLSIGKRKHQVRGHKTIILVRLDLGGAPHRNPDGVAVPCPHVHRYREGWGNKWAEPIDPAVFTDPADATRTLAEFLAYCRVTEPPIIEMGMLP